MYELSLPLAADQPFDKRKEKIISDIYLGMSPIHVRTVALVLSLYTGRVSPQFHVKFDTSFPTINGHHENLFPPRYCQAMCGFVKGKKSVFVNSRQHDSSTSLISPSDICHATSENYLEPE